MELLLVKLVHKPQVIDVDIVLKHVSLAGVRENPQKGFRRF